MLEQREERLAVRLRVKRRAAVAPERAPRRLQVRREVVERLGPQKEPARRTLSPAEFERAAQRVSVRILLELVVAAAALRAEADGSRERLEERGLPGAVLADEERDGRRERQRQLAAQEWDVERMRPRNATVLAKGDVREERAARDDTTGSSAISRWHVDATKKAGAIPTRADALGMSRPSRALSTRGMRVAPAHLATVHGDADTES